MTGVQTCALPIYSRTGNVQRFVDKLKKERPEWTYIKISEETEAINEGHLITYRDNIHVCISADTYKFLSGTSFAAPWVTRKLAYLIEILGLSREVAKALIVDVATGWEDTGNNQSIAPLIGHGSVPIKIDDIVKSKDNEIKFVINGISKEYDTYAYNIPVPVNKETHPFVAKATLCYFPKCSINQGVDYTNTELDISIGRINHRGIKTINKNTQTTGDFVYEGEARKLFRK